MYGDELVNILLSWGIDVFLSEKEKKKKKKTGQFSNNSFTAGIQKSKFPFSWLAATAV